MNLPEETVAQQIQELNIFRDEEQNQEGNENSTDFDPRYIIAADEIVVDGDPQILVNPELLEGNFVELIRYVPNLQPVTNEEADAAIEALRSNQLMNRFQGVFPQLSDPVVESAIFAEVMEAVTDPDIIARTRQNLLQFQFLNDQEGEEEDIEVNINLIENDQVGEIQAEDDEDQEIQNNIKWDALRTKFRCLKCQDVLAAPHALNCSHSFCGQCLKDHKESISSSSEVDVCHRCPECRTIISEETFERTFDTEISRQVRKLPNFAHKEGWERRRSAYFNSVLQQTYNSSSTRHHLNPQHQNQEQGNYQQQRQTTSNKKINFIIGGVIAVLTVVVIMIVGIARR